MREIRADVSQCPNDCDRCETVWPEFVEIYGKRVVLDDADLTGEVLQKIHRLKTCCPKGLTTLL